MSLQKHKRMNENLEKNFCSKTAKEIFKIGHDGIRLTKKTAYYEKIYENRNYFALMGSILK